MAGKRKKSEAQLKREKKKTKLLLAELLAIVVVLCLLLFWRSGVWQNIFPAITINGTNYHLPDFNYFYYAYYESFVEDNGDMVSYMFDESKSLKEQEYDDETGETWFEYFVDGAADGMKEITVLYSEAEQDGYSLDSGRQAEIDETMDALDSFAENLNKSTDEYLRGTYGRGMTRELYLKYLTMSKTAEGYIEQKKEEYTPSEEEISTEYNDNLKDYTTVSYERFYVKAADPEDEATDEERADAKKTAEEILAKVNEGQDLEKVSESYASKGSYHSFEDASYEEQSSYGSWLFDDAREDGDAAVIDDGNGFYVMVFHGRNVSDYTTANVIDMYFPLDTSLDSTDEQLEQSCEEAEDMLDKWKSGEGTEDSFLELAAKQSAESGSTYKYENMTKDTLDSDVEDWVFSEDRSAGDCEVLYTSSGFHLVYYSGEGEEAWKALVTENLQDQKYQEWYDKLMDSVSCKLHSAVLNHAAGY